MWALLASLFVACPSISVGIELEVTSSGRIGALTRAVDSDDKKASPTIEPQRPGVLRQSPWHRTHRSLVRPGSAPSAEGYVVESRGLPLSLVHSMVGQQSDRSMRFSQAVAGSKRLGSCAVVATGSSLRDSDLGQEIDAHDWVFRMNMALAKDQVVKDTGLRTDVVVAAHGLALRCIFERCWEEGGGAEGAVVIGNYDLDFVELQDPNLNGAKLYLYHRKYAREARVRHDVYALGDSRLQALARRLSSAQGAARDCASSFEADGLAQPSTGFMAVLLASMACDSVSLYGFGPSEGTAYSITNHGGTFSCNHDMAAEHRVLSQWAHSREQDAEACLPHPASYFSPGHGFAARFGPESLSRALGGWRPEYDAEDSDLLQRVCVARLNLRNGAGA